jgi:hypothetical protein
MNPPHMIFHVIHPAEDPPAPVPFTNNARVMLRLVASTVLLTREPALLGLRATLVPAEQMLAVAIEVLAQITASSEEGLRSTAWVGASPDPIAGGDAIAGEVAGGEGGCGWLVGRGGFKVGEDGGCWGGA